MKDKMKRMKIPLVYTKIHERIVEKCGKKIMTPREFRIIIAEFGLSRKDWAAVACELRDFGFLSEVSRVKIVMVDEKRQG